MRTSWYAVEVTSEERSSVKAKDIAGSTEAASRGIEMPATAEDLDASASPNVESPTEEPTAGVPGTRHCQHDERMLAWEKYR